MPYCCQTTETMPSPEVEFLQEYHIGRKEKAKTQHQPEKDLASSEDISCRVGSLVRPPCGRSWPLGKDAELSHT